MVYATASAKFSLPFAQLGLCPDVASSLLLPRIASYQRAAEKLLTGEAFDANEVVSMGFVNGVIDAAELEAYAMGKARKLAALPGTSLRLTKSRMKTAQANEVLSHMEDEAGHFARACSRRPRHVKRSRRSSRSASRISRSSTEGARLHAIHFAMRRDAAVRRCAGVPAWATQPAQTGCANAPTQMAMNECVGKSLKAADQKLNETYRTLAAKVSKDGAAQLKKTQRVWLAWRDAQCEFDTMGSRDGSIHTMVQAMCVEDLTRAQTRRLDAQLPCQEGDTACGGQ